VARDVADGNADSAETTIGGRTHLIAIGLMCAAVAAFACLDATAKHLGTVGYSTEQIVFVRYASNLTLLLLVVNPWTVPGVLRSERPMLQIGRAALLVGSTAMNFFALRYLQLAETVSIMFATPFITAILAGLVLRQWIGSARWVVIVIGFMGVLIVARPGSGALHWAAGLSFTGAICYAVYNLLTRHLAAHDPPTTTLMLGSLYGAVLTLPLVMIPNAAMLPATAFDALLLIATGAFGLVGHWLLILAHRHVAAEALSPFIYTQIVWMVLLGWIIFGDVPHTATLMGAGLVIASGLWLLALERKGAT
jgi:drug/metabolite transporter (DMT)-like permease